MYVFSSVLSNGTAINDDDGWYAPCRGVSDVWTLDEADATRHSCLSNVIVPLMILGFAIFMSIMMACFSCSSSTSNKITDGMIIGNKVVRVSAAIVLLSLLITPIIAKFSNDVENPSGSYIIASALDALLVIVSWLVHDETCAYYRGKIPFATAAFTALIHLAVLVTFTLQWLSFDASTDKFYSWASVARAIAAFIWVWNSFIRLFFCSKTSSSTTTSDSRAAYVALEDPSKEEEEIEHENVSPESRSGWWSRISFSWMNDLMRIGASRTLEDKDLYPLLSNDKTEFTASKLENSWKEEDPKSPSLSRAIRKALGTEFIMAGFIKFTYDTLQFVAPQLLKAIVGYLKDDVPKSDKGWWIVSLLCLNAACQTVLLHQYFHICFRTGMRIKAATAAIVFRKALVLDPAAMSENVEKVKSDKKKKMQHQETKDDGDDDNDEKDNKKDKKKKLNSRGAIVNLMSVDAQRLQDLCPYLHMLWSGPYQISLALYFLSRELGGYVIFSLSFSLFLFVSHSPSPRHTHTYIHTHKQIYRCRSNHNDYDDSNLGIYVRVFFFFFFFFNARFESHTRALTA